VVQIVEVGPRDGLQNEAVALDPRTRIAFIEQIIAAGTRRIEVASFVSEKRVPQMAGAETVIEGLEKPAHVTTIGLVLNQRGAERALATRIDELGVVTVASDAFALRNQKQTSAESVELAASIIRLARQEKRRVNVTISAAFGCPFEGEVPAERVVAMAEALAAMQPDEIAIADTIGVADPWSVSALFSNLRRRLPGMPLRAHFHNTRNTGLANAYAAIEAGVERLDASIGGVGGCPFAPAATGNLPTEDLLYMLERGGMKTGIDSPKTIETARWLAGKLARELPGMVAKAGGFPSPRQAA